jgi:type IV pilus assembly protein PilY1
MEDYCVVPPYVIQNVSPNIMIIIDNSGSMFTFAYTDGFNTTALGDDNSCVNSGTPCTGFTNPGTYPTYKYYGYFNPDYWYTYTSNRFIFTAPKTGSGLTGARSKANAEWDGNFLNWLTMRRIDIVRKVMTGGKGSNGDGSGYDRLVGEKADCDSRGTFKHIANVENYVDSAYSGTRCLRVESGGGTCNGSGSGTPSFDISSAASCSSFGSDYNVGVRVPVPVEGVLQRVVGAKARIGLTFYNTNEGGYVQVTVAGGSLSATVNQINLTRPSSNTPLGETVWTTTGYFAQQASIAGGAGPRYAAGDYQINNNVDPFNYGTGGQTRYPTCAKSFVLLVTDGEPCSDGNLPATILDYASGKSSFNCSGGSCPATSGTDYSFTASSFSACSAAGNVAGLEDVALYMHTTDLRSATLGSNAINGKQNLTLYNVFAFGNGSTLLKYASINGGFEDLDNSNTPNSQSEWDNNGDGEPDTYYEATDGAELEQKIGEAFNSMLKRASSGTAASVLASGEGQGANLIQAVFYPRRRFGNDVIAWTGLLQNLWYHVDPFFNNSNIIENTTDATEDKTLDLSEDYIVKLGFDTTLDKTLAKLYTDTNADGAPDFPLSPTEIRDFEDLNYLWEAGKLLWERNLTTTPRKLYTTLNGSAFLTNGANDWGFIDNNAATLAPYLNATDTNGNGSITDDAANIINYLHGVDIVQDANSDGLNDYRQRSVVIDDTTNVWKLGDILDSTPRIASWLQLNTYDAKDKYNDTTYNTFINTSDYKNRGMVYAGGNDGMLHAFKLGKLELTWDGKTPAQKARLTGSDLGKEMWGFIPKNALPYLKYISDPDYCHIYSVDLSPYLFDASIGTPGSGDISNNIKSVDGSTWRTILIGGMKTGGACASTSTTTATRPDADGDGSKDFVNTPTDVSGSSVGYSSYFALDVTDENNPQLLWEFSNSQLGYATTGPAVVRIGSDQSKNGKWFVVFGSGPTGPISTSDMQFMGRSDQNMRLFVLDLKTGTLLRTIDTGVQYAYAGSMLNSTNDSNMDYQDDALYFGYVKRTSSSPYTWTNGGVSRLVTKEDSNPANWVWSPVLDNIGPVTSSVARLQKNLSCYTSGTTGCLWLFFGTGRYYYAQEAGIDDQDGQRRIYGVKEPCITSAGGIVSIVPTCTTSASSTDVTAIGSVPVESAANAAGFNGWNIALDASSTGYGAERVITDPLAVTTGLIFFTTSKPYTDVCAIGGKTYIWALRYNTGGSAAALLKGTALIQVSTAAIEQIKLADAFTEKNGRRTSAMEGLPPTQQGLSIMTQPKPFKRTIHIKER